MHLEFTRMTFAADDFQRENTGASRRWNSTGTAALEQHWDSTGTALAEC